MKGLGGLNLYGGRGIGVEVVLEAAAVSQSVQLMGMMYLSV